MSEGNYQIFYDMNCNTDSDNAILVDIDGEDCWIPKSQIHNDSEVYKKGTDGELIVTTWICSKLCIMGDYYRG